MIDPITACQAVSLGRELLGLLQRKPEGQASDKPFGAVLASEMSGNAAQGAAVRPTAMGRVEELSQKLLQHPALRSMAGQGGFSVALLPDNSALVRSETGAEFTIGASDPSVRSLREAVAQVQSGQLGATSASGVMALRVSSAGRTAILG
jgi:hypothetical protein